MNKLGLWGVFRAGATTGGSLCAIIMNRPKKAPSYTQGCYRCGRGDHNANECPRGGSYKRTGRYTWSGAAVLERKGEHPRCFCCHNNCKHSSSNCPHRHPNSYLRKFSQGLKIFDLFIAVEVCPYCGIELIGEEQLANTCKNRHCGRNLRCWNCGESGHPMNMCWSGRLNPVPEREGEERGRGEVRKPQGENSGQGRWSDFCMITCGLTNNRKFWCWLSLLFTFELINDYIIYFLTMTLIFHINFIQNSSFWRFTLIEHQQLPIRFKIIVLNLDATAFITLQVEWS